MAASKPDPKKMSGRELKKAVAQGDLVAVETPVSKERAWYWRHWWSSPIAAVLFIVSFVLVLVWSTTFGRWKVKGWPVWVAGLAVAVTSPWPWLAAAILLAGLPRVRRRARVLSDQEAYLWAGQAAVVAMLHLATTAGLPAPWWVGAPLVIPGAVLWWWGRRIRKPSKFAEAWDEEVTGSSDYAGVRVTNVQVKEGKDGYPTGTATIVVPKGQIGERLAKDEESLVSLLSDAYPMLEAGSMSIAARVPGDPIRHARMLLSNPRDMGTNRYWEEPTLDPKTGMWTFGWTGHDAATARFWQPAGGLNTFAVSGPGKGKGGLTVLGGVEEALSPLILSIVIDGKRGAGVPSLRHGAALYARTPAQWWVAWEAGKKLLQMRFDEAGLAGDSLFVPSAEEPLIKITVDEWRYVHREFPTMVEDAVWITGQSRSIGGHLHLNLHKGDGPGFGDPEIRSNGYSNGQVWIGPQGDTAAEGVAVQGWGVDPGKLPPYPGWGYLCQTIDGDVASRLRAKNLWIPTEIEVKKLKIKAPFGTAEDHLRAGAINPALRPDKQKVIDDARELIESGRADSDPDITAAVADAARAGATRESVDDQIVAALAAVGESGAGAAQIAEMIERNRPHVQDRLKAMSEGDRPRVHQDAPRMPWRLVQEPAEMEPAQ